MVYNINIGQISNTSGVFIGLNNQPGWSNLYKENSTLNFPGSQGSFITGNPNFVIDNDVVDTPNIDRDIIQPGP